MGDPRCPVCGPKAGATATSCLHCGAEFDAPHGIDVPNHRFDTTSEAQDRGPSWLDRQLAPFRAFRDRAVYLLSPAARNDPEPPDYPDATEVLWAVDDFLTVERNRLDAAAVTSGFLILVYFVVWAVPDPLLGTLAGLAVIAVLFTRDTGLGMARVATIWIGLVTLVGRAGPVAARLVSEEGTELLAAVRALAVPTVVGVGFLALGVWLHRRVITGERHRPG